MHRIVPTSRLDSGGSSREIVRTLDVASAERSSAEFEENTLTVTIFDEARAAPTVPSQSLYSYPQATFVIESGYLTVKVCIYRFSNVFLVVLSRNETNQPLPILKNSQYIENHILLYTRSRPTYCRNHFDVIE